MKKMLKSELGQMRAGLSALLDKGFYEEEKKVGKWVVQMHILTDTEEAQVSAALKEYDLITREKVRPSVYLAHAVSEVNGIAFESLKEATLFFGMLTETLREAFVKAYNEMIPKSDEQIKVLLGELKNSSGPEKASSSGS